jgi:hypothetical protein
MYIPINDRQILAELILVIETLSGRDTSLSMIFKPNAKEDPDLTSLLERAKFWLEYSAKPRH